MTNPMPHLVIIDRLPEVSEEAPVAYGGATGQGQLEAIILQDVQLHLGEEGTSDGKKYW